jgi:hypothetical protein
MWASDRAIYDIGCRHPGITSEAEVLPPVAGRVDIRTAGKTHAKTGTLELLAAAREQASNTWLDLLGDTAPAHA